MMDSRIEQLLNALLNGEEPPIEPQSRNEAYLYSLCKQGIGSGGSGGGVSSWNDLTDKPFGETIDKIDIIPEQTVTFSGGSATFVDGKDPCYDLKLVEERGTMDAILVINGEVISGSIYYYYVPNGTFGSYTTDYDSIHLGDGASVKDGDTVTIRMYAMGEVVSKLDSKYIPANVPILTNCTYGEFVMVNDVDENGVPTKFSAVGVDNVYVNGDGKLVINGEEQILSGISSVDDNGNLLIDDKTTGIVKADNMKIPYGNMNVIKDVSYTTNSTGAYFSVSNLKECIIHVSRTPNSAGVVAGVGVCLTANIEMRAFLSSETVDTTVTFVDDIIYYIDMGYTAILYSVRLANDASKGHTTGAYNNASNAAVDCELKKMALFNSPTGGNYNINEIHIYPSNGTGFEAMVSACVYGR